MPIEFACESCKKLLRVPDGSGGLSCECPACRTLLEIPDPAAIKFVQTASGQDVSDKLQVPCPNCGVELACGRALLGTKGQCKNCKYIFTIATDSSVKLAASQETGWIFTCPKCDQLFAGRDEMRGRRGKCHSCGEVFIIDLRRASEPERGGSGSSADIASGATSSSSAINLIHPIQQDLPQALKPPRRLKDLKKPKSPTQRPPSTSPGKPSATTGGGSGDAASARTGDAGAGVSAGGNIRFTCSSCQGVMEVPESSVGLTTACPYCQLLLEIPAPVRRPGRTGTDPGQRGADGKGNAGRTGADPGQPGSDGTGNAMGEPINMGGNLFDLSAAGENPYAAPVPDMFSGLPGTVPGFSAGNMAPPFSAGAGGYSQAERRDAIVYLLPGIFIALFGVLQILGVAIYSIYSLSTLAGISHDARFNASLPGVQGAIAVLVIWGVVVFILSIVQIIGGIYMARRKGLTLARTAAVIACLPCFTCVFLNMPFGIWALVICLTGSVKRDFR